MFIGYYKYQIKYFLSQKFLKFRLRSQGLGIGICCNISKDILFGKNCKVGNYTCIGENVILGNDCRIGNNARINNLKTGNSTNIESGVFCTGNGKGMIIIGNNSYLGINNILDWSDDIVIGDFVHIAGPSTGLWTHSSAKQALRGLALTDKNPEFRPTAPICIENNVYIGGNCIIYPGTTVGHHAVVAPNSVVTKDVVPFTMVGGVPAKFIKKIKV